MFRRNKKTIRIKPNQVFLHERERFEPGKIYRVDVNLARYFDRNGWLEGSDIRPPIGAASLDVDDSTLGLSGGM